MKSVLDRQRKNNSTSQEHRKWVKMKQGSTEAKRARAVRREEMRSRFHRKYTTDEINCCFSLSGRKERMERWYMVTLRAMADIEPTAFNTVGKERSSSSEMLKLTVNQHVYSG